MNDICTWELEDTFFSVWESECGILYQFIEGGPKDNGHNYCHYCGKKLVIKEEVKDDN